MKHIFNKGKDSTKPTLLLLHGTGGNELDLLPIAGRIGISAKCPRKCIGKWNASILSEIS